MSVVNNVDQIWSNPISTNLANFALCTCCACGVLTLALDAAILGTRQLSLSEDVHRDNPGFGSLWTSVHWHVESHSMLSNPPTSGWLKRKQTCSQTGIALGGNQRQGRRHSVLESQSNKALAQKETDADLVIDMIQLIPTDWAIQNIFHRLTLLQN